MAGLSPPPRKFRRPDDRAGVGSLTDMRAWPWEEVKVATWRMGVPLDAPSGSRRRTTSW